MASRLDSVVDKHRPFIFMRRVPTPVKRTPPKTALVGDKIADQYKVPVRMNVKIFLDRRDRKKATRKFLRRSGNSRQNWIVLQGETDEAGRESRSDYILNGLPKGIDIDRRMQM